MKLVGYLRVSTNGQAENGTSLDGQRAEIESWATRTGHEVVRFRSDEGVSGAKDLDDRDGLAEALDIIKEGGAQGVVVWRLDRLARDLILQERLIREVWDMQGHVFSTAEGEDAYLRDDPDDPSRKLIRQVLGAVAEYEREMIKLRLRRGKHRRRRADTRSYVGGYVPYGFRAENKMLVELPHEQEAIALMRLLRAQGWTLAAIATRLSKDGFRPRSARRWSAMAVKKVLDRVSAG